MAYELDKKDRAILYNLDLNSRQSFNQLAKRVGLSREVVQYRVKQLEKRKLIWFDGIIINKRFPQLFSYYYENLSMITDERRPFV
jgi:DNA-binding Lrp family transcriptional regulator